jgi:hypothetical protein
MLEASWWCSSGEESIGGAPIIKRESRAAGEDWRQLQPGDEAEVFN